MIIAVEGPSAAGKTTWCRLHCHDVVAEYSPTGSEPDGSDPAAQAAYWVAANSRRWTEARDLERRTGLAVCDSDPLKLHYSWSLARIGEASWSRFAHDLIATRRAFAAETLGMVDLVIVSIPPLAELRRHRDADPTRTRRSFDLHARLASPLREWYQAVDALDPGRVIWDFPVNGMPESMPTPRDGRSDPSLLDHLMEHLPAH
jgi:hypothetical protein